MRKNTIERMLDIGPGLRSTKGDWIESDMKAQIKKKIAERKK